MAPLVSDPRLMQIAQDRASFLISHHFFSHCTDGEADPTCPQSQVDVVPRLQTAGFNITQTAIGENLALNNYFSDFPSQAVVSTNQDWLHSSEHRANILNAVFTNTGLAVVCCFTGNVDGQTLTASEQVYAVVEVFTGGAGVPPLPASAGGDPSCQFMLGFAALEQMIPKIVGVCLDNEQHNPANGDGLQHTTGGLLVWRKADNWTAFTDGYRTWINGPYGLVERLNMQRFRWEANPQGLPVIGS
ncbi:MAG: CAP domain-containing protein [Chloroflexi bacterium]|nr:CAP domain-containing protein [Chloroflexota bacterium]